MDQPFLQVKGISKSFAGVQALQDVDLTIDRGEVRCLAGENGSGKSTLIKIIAGAQPPDSGTIVIDGKEYAQLTPLGAIHAGVQIIYQDFSLFQNLTVEENLSISKSLASGRRFVNWREVKRTARGALELVGVEIPLSARVEDLPVADKQLIAIARALVNDAKLLILDEPTTALTQREIDGLLATIGRLQERGVAVMFVSHKLNEMFAIAESISVLRNGRLVKSAPASEFDYRSLSEAMTGQSLDEAVRSGPGRELGSPLLEVRGLSKRGQFEEISFTLHRGEILGLAGLLGSGRTALGMSLFGLTSFDSGELKLDGDPLRLRTVQDAIDHGIAYLPEDRLTEGLFLTKSIGDNITVSSLPALAGRMGLLNRDHVRREKEEWVERMKVATPSHRLPVQSLSGGNQQRVLLARWLAAEPRLLVLNGPTVGVDVGSKAAIHELIRELTGDGIAVLVISDDLSELTHVCDRLLVMRGGRITEEVVAASLSENELAARLAA